jgi:hypothetical protein
LLAVDCVADHTAAYGTAGVEATEEETALNMNTDAAPAADISNDC